MFNNCLECGEQDQEEPPTTPRFGLECGLNADAIHCYAVLTKGWGGLRTHHQVPADHFPNESCIKPLVDFM